jgi:hypothetical protein
MSVPVQAEPAPTGTICRRNPGLRRDECPSTAVRLNPHVERDLGVARGIKVGELLRLQHGRLFGWVSDSPRSADLAEDDLAPGPLLQEQEPGADHVVEGERWPRRSPWESLEDSPQAHRETAQFEQHTDDRRPGQITPPDCLPGSVRVSVDDQCVDFGEVEAREVVL